VPKAERTEADRLTRFCRLNELVGCSAWGPDKRVFDVHIIVSATHLDEDPRFLVTVFQSVGDQVVRFALKNEMIEVVRGQGEVRWDLANVAPARLCDSVVRLKK
jgi:hypothetical protein